MDEYLKKYNVTLTIKGPVFIGNGKEIGKKEYVFIGRNRVGILNSEKFYRFISKRHLRKEFEEFMMKNYRDDLTSWIRKNKMSLEDIVSCLKYTLEAGDSVIENGKKLQIMECIKDPYGRPYIPGSSIKGMFRTIFLGVDIISNSEKYQSHMEALKRNVTRAADKNRFLSNDIASIEAKGYRTLKRNADKPFDTVNDIMSGFTVSDSEPIDVGKLVLCQKIERHVDGLEKKLNLLRECIEPETKVHFTITIDSKNCLFTKEGILQAVNVFKEDYYKNFSSKFRYVDRPSDNEVYLGGGVGFVSKTEVYPLFQKDGIAITQNIFDKTGVTFKHKHKGDLELGVSPHILKCTRYGGATIQMGRCQIEEIV